MFEYIRTHQRLMMFILVILIIPPFALFGIDGYIRMVGEEGTLAKVEGVKITQQMFEFEQRQEFDQLRNSLGTAFNPAQFNTPDMRQRLFDNMIRRRLFDWYATKNYLGVSDEYLREAIANEPELQTNGKFDLEKYKIALAARNMNSAIFEQNLRYQMLGNQYSRIVASTAFAPQWLIEHLFQIQTQQREVQVLTYSPSEYIDQVKVDEATIKNYYESNPKKFQTPEQVNIEYVILDMANISSKITIKEEDAFAYYKQNIARFGTPEERRASHILITSAVDAKPEEKTKARKLAEEVLAKVKKNPNDFAKLAKQYSQDPGSAAQGGDLGYFGRNMMAKPFEEAVFTLKQDEISPIVETEFGFHIIRLTGIKVGQTKSFDSVRSQIEAELRKNEAIKKFAEAAEQFSNMVYEQSDSLKPVITRFELKAEVLNGVGREGLLNGNKINLLNNKMLNTLFSEDVLKKNRNTEAVEIAPNTLAAAHILSHKAATRQPLSDVQNVIRAELVQQEAQKLAIRAGTEKLTRLRQQPNDQGFGEKIWVSRIQPKNIDWKAVKEIFKADTKHLPAFVGIDLGAKGFAIYRVDQIGAVTLDDAKRAQLRSEIQRVDRLLGVSQDDAVYEVIKTRAKVKIIQSPAELPANS